MDMALLPALFFSLISAIFEEKSLVLIEKTISSNKNLSSVVSGSVPAIALFALSGFCYLLQAYFLRQAGVQGAIIAFGVWMCVVVGLLLKDSPELLKNPVNVVFFLLAMLLLGVVQVRIMK